MVIEPFRGPRDLLVTIVGISSGVADVIIAETGADMARFPTAGHLASGAGTCPGFNDAAGWGAEATIGEVWCIVYASGGVVMITMLHAAELALGRFDLRMTGAWATF